MSPGEEGTGLQPARAHSCMVAGKMLLSRCPPGIFRLCLPLKREAKPSISVKRTDKKDVEDGYVDLLKPDA